MRHGNRREFKPLIVGCVAEVDTEGSRGWPVVDKLSLATIRGKRRIATQHGETGKNRAKDGVAEEDRHALFRTTSERSGDDRARLPSHAHLTIPTVRKQIIHKTENARALLLTGALEQIA